MFEFLICFIFSTFYPPIFVLVLSIPLRLLNPRRTYLKLHILIGDIVRKWPAIFSECIIYQPCARYNQHKPSKQIQKWSALMRFPHWPFVLLTVSLWTFVQTSVLLKMNFHLNRQTKYKNLCIPKATGSNVPFRTPCIKPVFKTSSRSPLVLSQRKSVNDWSGVHDGQSGWPLVT